MDNDFDPGTPGTPAAGAHRRQVFVIVASAASVLALVSASALGMHAWQHRATSSSAAIDLLVVPSASSLQSAVARSSNNPLASPPPATTDALPPSPAPISTAPEQSASPTVRPTPCATRPSVAPPAEIDERVTIQLSTTRVALGQQLRATVTVLNAGRTYAPPVEVAIGSMIPSDTFDSGPKGCVFELGGALCPTVGLRPGQRTSLVFAITPGWMPAASGYDVISGTLHYTDSHGQQQQDPGFQANVWVDDGTATQAPPTPSASSSALPPPASAAASSALG